MWGTVRDLMRALSPRDEFIIVVVAAFGTSILVNLTYLIPMPSTTGLMAESDLVYLLIDEPIVLIVLAVFLHARGWSLETIGLGPNFAETIFGISLAFVVGFVSSTAWTIAIHSSERMLAALESFKPIEGTLSPATIVLVSIINPIFEEVFLCGYVMTALRKHTTIGTAIGVSVAIRQLCHVYQGVVGLPSILPMGLIFAGAYARTGRLWPLIVAHVLFDFVALVAYQGR